MLTQVYFGSTDWEKWAQRIHRLQIRWDNFGQPSLPCSCRGKLASKFFCPRKFYQNEQKFESWHINLQSMEKTIDSLSSTWNTRYHAAFGTRFRNSCLPAVRWFSCDTSNLSLTAFFRWRVYSDSVHLWIPWRWRMWSRTTTHLYLLDYGRLTKFRGISVLFLFSQKEIKNLSESIVDGVFKKTKLKKA